MSSNAEIIEQSAADWIARQLSGAWTAAEQEQFDAWIAANAAHRIAYLRLDAAWERVGRLKALKPRVPAGIVPTSEALSEDHFPYQAAQGARSTLEDIASSSNDEIWAGPKLTAHRSSVRKMAVAAGLVLIIGAGFYLAVGDVFSTHRYSTQVGALHTVPLQDGSHVTLNTDTRLRVALDGHERRVELDRGEAFFDVAKDPVRPFVVAVADKRIVAVGTQFSVRRDHDRIRVAVSEGRVRIEGDKEVLVGAGAVAETEHARVAVLQNSSPKVEQLLSWRQGLIALHETPLSEAVAEFNRYNERKIIIRDASIADIRVGGSFRSTNADAFLWMLQKGFAISTQRTETGVILQRD
jgi:transmembrane sensor